jgi:hypothetical protein
MLSAVFPLSPNTIYMFAYWTKSSGAGGVYPMIANVVEQDAGGNFLIQEALSADFGTTAWTLKTKTFATDSRCAQGYLRVLASNSHGTTWIDGIQLYQQPSTPGLVSNGGFESGTTSPTGWILPTGSVGSWSWDATSGMPSAGVSPVHSARVSIPGTVSVTGTQAMHSDVFALSPGTSYLFSYWTMSSGAGGVQPMIANLVEVDSSGNFITQHAASADFGTVNWNRKIKSFVTDPRCAKGYVRVTANDSYGKTWIDLVQLNQQ